MAAAECNDVTPYPHGGGCPGCRKVNLCNVCGRDRFHAGRGGACTNGRCYECHAACCTGGGDQSPGHGFGQRTKAEHQAKLVASARAVK